MVSEPSFPLELPKAFVDALADRLAVAVIERLSQPRESYMSVEQAAEYLACKRQRIYDLVSKRQLRHHRDGKRLLFARADLDARLRTVERE